MQDIDARITRARSGVVALQLAPAAVLTGLGAVARAGIAPLIAPAIILPLCLWQLRRSWNRPRFWATGGGYAAAVAGLATGAVTGFGIAAGQHGSPGLGVVLAFAGALVFPGLVAGGAALLRRSVLAAPVADLARTSLEIPFRVLGSGANLLVGRDTLTLWTQKYRPGMVWRTVTTTAELSHVHVLDVRPMTEPADVELAGLFTTARVRAPADLLHLRTGRDRWTVPLADAGPVTELIRLRKRDAD